VSVLSGRVGRNGQQAQKEKQETDAAKHVACPPDRNDWQKWASFSTKRGARQSIE
jgi:hypothetical protein